MGYYQRWCSELNDILRFMGRRGRIIRGPKPRVVFSCHVSGTGYIRECTVVYSTRCVRDNETTVMMWTQLFLYATAKSVRFCARPFIFLLLSNKKKKKTKVVPHDGHTPDFFSHNQCFDAFRLIPQSYSNASIHSQGNTSCWEDVDGYLTELNSSCKFAMFVV